MQRVVETRNIFQSRIGRKMVVAIVLFSSLITLGTTAIQIYLDYRQDIGEINADLDMVESSYLPSLVNSVWVFDDNQTQVQLEGILGLPGMVYLEIRNNEKIFFSVGSVTSKRLIEKEFPLVHHEGSKVETIGSLLVVNNLDRVYERLIDRIITILISNGIKTFLVAGFMLLLFHYLVTRHLVDLARRLGHFYLGEQEGQQSLGDPVQDKDADEVEQVLNIVNSMQDRITTAYDEVQRSENRFRELISQMSAGFALHEIIVNDDGTPIDYCFLEINEFFEKLTGLKREEVVGRTVLDVLPQTEDYWIETYGKVAVTGQSVFTKIFRKNLESILRLLYTALKKTSLRLSSLIYQNVNELKKNQKNN